jgi:hypothetical protein
MESFYVSNDTTSTVKRNNFFHTIKIMFSLILGCVLTSELFLHMNLFNLYSSPSIIKMIKSRRMRWTGHVARTGAKRNADRSLVENPEGKRPLGRPTRRWVNNIKMDLREM